MRPLPTLCISNYQIRKKLFNTTYFNRETHIVVDEKQKSSDIHETLVTSSLCNLISRHWLGGFVTPVNWDYAWLTDALAGYMELILTPMVKNFRVTLDYIHYT